MVTKFFGLYKSKILIKFNGFKGFYKILKIALFFNLNYFRSGKANTKTTTFLITHNNTES